MNERLALVTTMNWEWNECGEKVVPIRPIRNSVLCCYSEKYKYLLKKL